ncbi:MAG: T9SS type A sorting domain-containing protein, partial [Bacteroidota bacterium]|nr:T9SS type A sorting domain-containing protein [Bacteroidota bacterium]
TATATIPTQPDGSVIWYTLRAEDNLGQYADFPPQGAKSKPFFIVRDGALRIRDIQYTPFSDGVPGCLGATATVRGTVISQADTSSLGIVYIQDAEEPWSGILVRGDAAVRALTLGDDVTVRGTVAEGYSSSTAGNTALIDATVVDTHGKAALPDPIVLTTGRFQSGLVTDGTPEAEMYEGMLLRFNDLTITARNADEGSGFYGEFLVDDGSGPMRVDDLGQWKTVYTNDTTKKNLILLEAGMTIRSLTGIMFYSYGNYKLEPRNVADFDGLTDVDKASPLPLSIHAIELYPNPAPAGETTTIRFVTPVPGPITLDVFDALGRRVASLLDTRLGAGAHSFRFPTSGLPAGMYITRLQGGGWTAFGRFLIH